MADEFWRSTKKGAGYGCGCLSAPVAALVAWLGLLATAAGLIALAAYLGRLAGRLRGQA